MKKQQKNKKERTVKQKIKLAVWTAAIMFVGLIIFKYIPMAIWGKDILFDASSHVAWTTWGLYAIFLFIISTKKSWKVPYFIIAGLIIIAMAIQRIIAHEHNLIGVLLGFAVVTSAILIPRWKEIKGGRK